MKKIDFSCKWAAVAALLLCGTACDDNDDRGDATESIAGSYSGYTLSSCAYFSQTCVGDETVALVSNADGSVSVDFTSATWGRFTIPNASVSGKGNTRTLSGEGTTVMGMGQNGSKSYPCTVTGTIRSTSDAEIAFSVPSVMGGLDIVFATGYAPAGLLLPGTYEGYTAASCAYFQNTYTNDESLKIDADADGKLSISYTSATWGTFEATDLAAGRDANTYSIAGEGSVAMGMGDSTKSYPFTVTGAVNAAKDRYAITFSVPTVMGGLSIVLMPGDAPQTQE